MCVNITNNVTVEANFSITARTDADEGNAEIEDFDILGEEIVLNGRTCFKIMIFPDNIVEEDETFQVSIESLNSALNVTVPQAEVTILDSTSKSIVEFNKLPDG